jgi:hypothetical protein
MRTLTCLLRNCRASVLLVTIAYLAGCSSHGQVHTFVENSSTMMVSDLPKEVLETVDTASESSVTSKLKSQDALTLDGTTLIVGDVGANRTVMLTASTLKLINGARIITNGNQLSLVALNMEFNNSGGIDSFYGETVKAAAGMKGSDAGKVEIYATESVKGSVSISLPGQYGGDGSTGSPGNDGVKGAPGANGVDGLFDCKHGGTDGAQGTPGADGSVGGMGKSGGNGGDLILRGKAVIDYESHFPYQAPPGSGGLGGAGGKEGAGGPGGEGGSGSAHCGGGRAGQKGADGHQGPSGQNGPNGTTSGRKQLK